LTSRTSIHADRRPDPGRADGLDAVLRKARRRTRLYRSASAAMYGVGAGLLMLACWRWIPGDVRPAYGAMAAAVAAVVTLGLGAGRPSDRAIAWAADRALGLQERLSSALEMRSQGASSALARLQLADTERAAATAGWSDFDESLRRPLFRAAAALGLAFCLAVGMSLWPAEPAAVGGAVTRQDVAEAAAVIAALAQDTADETLQDIARTLDELARTMTDDGLSAPQAQVLASQLQALSEDAEQASAAWDALESGSVGLAERMASAAPAKPNPYATGHGTQANTGAAGDIAEAPEPQDDSGEIRVANLPGGADTGESAGLPLPPQGVEADALGDEEGYSADNLPPMTGSAGGSGEGESNMAGSGSEPDAGSPDAAPPAAAGFDETQILEAATTTDGARRRTSDVTEARRTEQAAMQARSDWPRVEPAIGERQSVPVHARPTVERLFFRPEYAP
jgi:hypothetical protein